MGGSGSFWFDEPFEGGPAGSTLFGKYPDTSVLGAPTGPQNTVFDFISMSGAEGYATFTVQGRNGKGATRQNEYGVCNMTKFLPGYDPYGAGSYLADDLTGTLTTWAWHYISGTYGVPHVVLSIRGQKNMTRVPDVEGDPQGDTSHMYWVVDQGEITLDVTFRHRPADWAGPETQNGRWESYTYDAPISRWNQYEIVVGKDRTVQAVVRDENGDVIGDTGVQQAPVGWGPQYVTTNALNDGSSEISYDFRVDDFHVDIAGGSGWSVG